MYEFLRKEYTNPRQPELYDKPPTIEFLRQRFPDYEVAFDLETYGGLDPHAPGTFIRCLGLASKSSVAAFDFGKPEERSVEDIENIQAAFEWLNTKHTIAHNWLYDASWVQRHHNITLGTELGMSCSRAYFQYAASEGFDGQNWGLKTAMTDVLGWVVANNLLLKDWLHQNKLSADEMSLAPWAVLGKYCALDAEASWLLTSVIKKQWSERLPREQATAWTRFMHREWQSMTQAMLATNRHGLPVNLDKLQENHKALQVELENHKAAFLNTERVAPFIKAYNDAIVEALVGKRPPQFTKGGKETKRYTNWLRKVEEARTTNYFNLNSPKQMRWLLCDMLGYKTGVLTKSQTTTPQESTGKKARSKMGDIGAALDQVAETQRLINFAESLMYCQVDGVWHPLMRLPGTVTGRAAGGSGGSGKGRKLNIQNLPKKRPDILECFVTKPGWSIVYTDINALEPTVLTYYSRDVNLLRLYGPDAKPNDVYLFFGAHTARYGDQIRRIYDPYNPTKESIAEAKRLFKKERAQLKTIYLGFQYGLGIKTLAQDTGMSEAEAAQVHHDYHKMHAGAVRFRKQLEKEYADNGGWFTDGYGRAVTVSSDKKLLKDIMNRFVQNTGHVILMMLSRHLVPIIQERKINAVPYLPDEHDALMWTCPDEQVPELKEAFIEAYKRLNNQLNWDVKIKGDVGVGKDLWEVKGE